MERLSGLDASFLYIESPTQPLHVCSILELDTSTVPGGYTFDRLRDELALRIAAIPEFRAKLADSQLNLDYPVWVEDEAFDVDRHLLRIGLPSPGGRRELAEVCGHIATAPLERDRPLWEMWVIEGVCDTDPCAGGRRRREPQFGDQSDAVAGLGAARRPGGVRGSLSACRRLRR
jgi:diacylglycerol O-acyltransferase / wax synthase